MIKTKEELIRYYEKNLDNVISTWGKSVVHGQDYIDHAKKEFEEVKNGREW